MFVNTDEKLDIVQLCCVHLVPAFERVFPPLHQVALTDPWDTEVQRGARNCTLFQLLQVIHHLPMTRLTEKTPIIE